MNPRHGETISAAEYRRLYCKGGTSQSNPVKGAPERLGIAKSGVSDGVSPKRKSKYGNKKTIRDGKTFDSKKEADRYDVLKMEYFAGAIQELRLQVVNPIVVNGVKVCSYRSDFEYVRDGKRICEDVKGFKTGIYRLKKKLMKACYGADILET